MRRHVEKSDEVTTTTNIINRTRAGLLVYGGWLVPRGPKNNHLTFVCLVTFHILLSFYFIIFNLYMFGGVSVSYVAALFVWAALEWRMEPFNGCFVFFNIKKLL